MPSFRRPTGILVLALALLPLTIASYVTSLPARTEIPHFPFSQIYPLPTKAPSPPAALLVRDDDDETSSVETALMGPDNICGYISGRPGASFYCPASSQCIFFTAKTTQNGNVACCNTEACAAKITCMDYQQVVESSRCDDGCMVDPFTLKCTDSEFPYCNTVSFPLEIYDYACNNVDISTPQAIFTTYEGQTSDRRFTPLPLTEEETGPITGFGRPTPSGDPEEEEEGEEEEGGEERGGGGGGGGGKKKNHAGAIAGGVVGGVAVIGLIGLGVLFILRRKKKDAPPATPATQQTTPGWTHPNSPQGGYAAGYFKPGQEPPNYTQGLAPAPDRNSSASPRESTLVGSPTAYGYQQQFQQGVQGVPAQGQQVPQGQQPHQGQPVTQGQQPLQGQPVPQGQQPPPQGQPQGLEGPPRHELGMY